jgi:hypothetical protein
MHRLPKPRHQPKAAVLFQVPQMRMDDASHAERDAEGHVAGLLGRTAE